ncbi:hypothetical protein Ciccas_002048 [Cichlidogyrus casuarinus]|uniref:Uncharacterized protein n=1 Tax=Cichlidogyrus casuarinus TaxID=1844966 RepID=A0ABD2QLI4_9PLAT
MTGPKLLASANNNPQQTAPSDQKLRAMSAQPFAVSINITPSMLYSALVVFPDADISEHELYSSSDEDQGCEDDEIFVKDLHYDTPEETVQEPARFITHHPDTQIKFYDQEALKIPTAYESTRTIQESVDKRKGSKGEGTREYESLPQR